MLATDRGGGDGGDGTGSNKYENQQIMLETMGKFLNNYTYFACDLPLHTTESGSHQRTTMVWWRRVGVEEVGATIALFNLLFCGRSVYVASGAVASKFLFVKFFSVL